MRKTLIFIFLVFSLNAVFGFSLKDLGSGKKYFKKAEKFYSEKNYISAIPLYLKFLSKKKNKNNEKALYHLSVCYMETGNPDQGFPFISRLYRLKKTKLEYAVLYAEYLVQLNRLKDAIEVYRAVINLHPDDYLSYIRLGELLVNNGNLKEARAVWLKATKLKEKPVEAFSLLSDSYLKVEKNRLLAYFYARKLYEIAPDDKKDELKKSLDAIAGDFREDFENYYQLRTCKEKAKNFIEKGDFERAYKTLHQCEDLNNIDKDYLMLFADVAKKLKRYEKAIEIYKKCLALGIENGYIYLELGKCYLKTGKKDLARASLKMACKFKETKIEAKSLLNSLQGG